jgi:hypothetical protein
MTGLARLGAAALLEALPGIADGSLEALPQHEAEATYAAKLDKAEALLDWSRPASALARCVQAFNPWPVAETLLDEARVRLWRARVAQPAPGLERPPGTLHVCDQGRLLVAAGEGWLEVLELQWPGRRAMTAAECLAGPAADVAAGQCPAPRDGGLSGQAHGGRDGRRSLRVRTRGAAAGPAGRCRPAAGLCGGRGLGAGCGGAARGAAAGAGQGPQDPRRLCRTGRQGLSPARTRARYRRAGRGGARCHARAAHSRQPGPARPQCPRDRRRRRRAGQLLGRHGPSIASCSTCPAPGPA